MSLVEDIGTQFLKKKDMNEHAWAKTIDFLNHQYIFSLRFFFTKPCIKIILNYLITEWFDITFFFLQNVCKMAINGFSIK